MVKIIKTDRANKVFVYFNAPISPISMANLHQDASFIGRFSRVDILKHNEDIVGIHLIDEKSIYYTINIDSIEAYSSKLSESKVKDNLNLLAKGLLNRIGRQITDFEVDDKVDHKTLEFDLRKLLNKELVSKLTDIFKKKGYQEPDFMSLKLVATKENKVRLFQFFYPNKKDKEKNYLVVESNKELIKDTIKIFDELENDS